jgi:hypothetical protein
MAEAENDEFLQIVNITADERGDDGIIVRTIG